MRTCTLNPVTEPRISWIPRLQIKDISACRNHNHQTGKGQNSKTFDYARRYTDAWELFTQNVASYDSQVIYGFDYDARKHVFRIF